MPQKKEQHGKNSSYSKSFVRDNLLVITGTMLTYMKGIILMPIIIKTVGVQVYGGFALLTSVMGIVFGISSFGVGFRANRFLPSAETMQERRELFYPQFFFQLASIVFFSSLLLVFDRELNLIFFKNEISYTPYLIPLYLISYFLYAQGSNFFRYTSRVHYMTTVNLVFPYIHIALLLCFFYYFNFISINVIMLTHAASAFLISLPCFLVVFNEIGIKFITYSFKGLVSDIRIGFPLVLNFIVDFVLAGSDRYLIAFYLTVSDVGYYNPAYALGSLIAFVPKAMGTALPQLLCRAVDSKKEAEAQTMLNYAIKIFLLLAIPYIFGCIAIGKTVLTILANQEVAERAFCVTPVVALGTLFYGLNIIISNVLFVRMKTSVMFKANVFAAVFNLLANAIFIFLFRDIIVAAITTSVSYFLVFMYLHKTLRHEGWLADFQPVTWLKSLVASVTMLTVFIFFPWSAETLPGIVVLIANFVACCLIYFFMLFALRTFSKKELLFIKGYFLKND